MRKRKTHHTKCMMRSPKTFYEETCVMHTKYKAGVYIILKFYPVSPAPLSSDIWLILKLDSISDFSFSFKYNDLILAIF